MARSALRLVLELEDGTKFFGRGFGRFQLRRGKSFSIRRWSGTPKV